MSIERTHPRAAARFDLHGKVAWVVGGSGVLGAPVCRALAEHGAHVVVADIREERAQTQAQSMKADGLSAEAMSCDAGNEESIVRCANEVMQRHGRMDVLVCMAYFYTKTPMEEMTAAQWEKGMRVTLTGAFLTAREGARIMRSQKCGSIIQFSSMYGVVSPDPRMYGPGRSVNPIDYGVAKAGVLQMVRYQAVMLAPHGVRVNAIVPGPFLDRTDEEGQDVEFEDRLNAKSPMGRTGRPTEIEGAVVYLASDASSYVTGTSLQVDGGWCAW